MVVAAQLRMSLLPSKASAFVAANVVASCLWIGCGSSVTYETGGSGGSGGGDSGGTTATGTTTTPTTTTSVVPAITALRAPDQTSVRIEVSAVIEAVPQSPSAYAFASEHGPLAVKAVTWDAAAKAIVLETEKQKLGVEYTLTIVAPGDPLDTLGGSMLAADTATFWATDFATFEPYEVQAERVGVGDRVVLYVDPAFAASDIDETIAQFDSMIFPIETDLFHPAPDRDDNGRIVLFGLDGQQYYGGYFDPTNSVTEATASQWGYHSNEMEILYLNVAALGGFWPDIVVAHEFQHLLYQEQHPFLVEQEYFEYHNEGLAECATHAVYGSNTTAADYYVSDPEGQLATGKSLVLWDFGNYSQYAQAYVFWTYIAAHTGGVSGYRDLFLSNGSPKAIEDLLLAKLGAGFADTQLHALAAAWLQAPAGPYGFEGMLSLLGSPVPVPAGTTSLQLAPFAAAFFPQTSDGITATGAGPDVLFLGLDASKKADADAPFDVAGGAVLALNGRLEWKDPTPQSSGVLGTSMAGAKINPAASSGSRDLAWLHPPPLPPVQGGGLQAWRKRTSGF
jgi:hypothetical protein